MGRMVSFLVLAAWIMSGTAYAAEKVTWDWALFGPPRALTVGMDHIAETVAEKTGGNFTINLHYGESVAPVREFLDSMKIDAIQGALVAFNYTPGKVPLQGALGLPYLPIPNPEVQIKVHEAFYDYPPVSEELAQWNTRVLVPNPTPQYELMGSGTPPRTLDAWKGRRVRALGGVGDAMRLLGAVPTSVPAPEVYTALDRGMIDAVAFPFAYTFGAYRTYEVSNWYTVGFNLGIVPTAIAVSRTAWERLPAEYKTMLEELRPEAQRLVIDAYTEADARWIPAFKEAGLEEIRISSETLTEVKEIAGRPIWEKWVAETEAKNLPGRDVLNLILAEAEKAGGS